MASLHLIVDKRMSRAYMLVMPDFLNVNSLLVMSAIFILTPFIFTAVSMPHFIRQLKEKCHTVRDMYKSHQPSVPTNGGLIIMLVSIFSFSILTLFYQKFITPINYAIIVVVVLFAFFGIIDDMINIGRPAKLILLYYCSYPILPFILTTSIILPFFGPVDLSAIYPQIIITVYIPVVANLVNMHSGFNGLAPGTSFIILMTLVFKTYVSGTMENALFLLCLAGALGAYFLFEKYPSRIFWGNIGALSVGSAIGAFIVTQGFIFSGFIMLIPHTVNFLMYVYWRLNIKRYPICKFGSVTEDGTLIVPNPLTLKWVVPYYMKMKEPRATNVMFAITAVFCIIGFFIQG